ncbi:MAG: SPASM domain-containing protein [Candidatus Eremiobacteraeota bacterium]|nr:SPASM domain-containing protein [Candidatus Eremiobacteraeota bacterium]
MRVNPERLRLETSTFCQLRCPSCPTTQKAIDEALGRGFLTFARFKRFLDENDWIKELELSNYGEPFLNQELPDILQYADRKAVSITLENGANFNSVSDAALEAVVQHGVRAMVISIDGATQEVYSRYRVRGMLDRVLANIRRINHFKTLYERSAPLLIWQFIIFGYNEHELPQAKAMARGLGMAFFPKLSWDEERSPIRDPEFVKRETGLVATSRTEFRTRFHKEYLDGICTQLWKNPQINWDGTVLGCCRNFWGNFGSNAFETPALEAINSEPMQYARQMLRGAAKERADIPCTTCSVYLQRKVSGNWVTVRKEPGIS